MQAILLCPRAGPMAQIQAQKSWEPSLTVITYSHLRPACLVAQHCLPCTSNSDPDENSIQAPWFPSTRGVDAFDTSLPAKESSLILIHLITRRPTDTLLNCQTDTARFLHPQKIPTPHHCEWWYWPNATMCDGKCRLEMQNSFAMINRWLLPSCCAHSRQSLGY